MKLQQATKTSTPSFFEFNPQLIPYQYRVIHDIKCNFDYSLGPHYVLLSGSIGSAKSCLMAWIIIKHCTEFDGARALIGRKSMPDLKDTIFLKIIEMLEGAFIEGVDYSINYTTTTIKFRNGSEIITRSWHDRKYKKFRSLELSLVAIEELTENDARDWEFFIEVIGRLERLPHVPENIFIAATNPDDPSHEAYKFFIKDSIKSGYKATKNNNIHTYYSLTEQNPFLPKSYMNNLMNMYDSKMIRRLLYGEWLYIKSDVIYYEYNPDKHFILENTVPDVSLPLRLTFDFNIRKGKPMSSAAFTYNKRTGKFIFIDEVAIEGARTRDALEEWGGKGYFDLPHNPKIIIHGDAAGHAGDSRGYESDYTIIEKYLANYSRKDRKRLEYEIDVPRSNPAVRDRHNTMNGQLCNAYGESNIAIDRRCTMIDAGLSNTRLKEGSQYMEDQDTEGQDISTAISYGVHYVLNWGIDYEDIVL